VAEASVSVRDTIFDPFRVAVTDEPPPREITGTESNFRVVSEEAAARRAAQTSGLSMTSDEIADEVEVVGEDGSDAVRVEATAPSAAQAAAVANAFVASYVELWRMANGSKVERARSQASPQVLAEGLVPGKASVLQPAATPSSPSKPRTLLNTLLGGALGLFLGVALAVMVAGKSAQVLRFGGASTD
jgi:uncharacterized protein involved in exopolysaccharide biosynthesis